MECFLIGNSLKAEAFRSCGDGHKLLSRLREREREGTLGYKHPGWAFQSCPYPLPASACVHDDEVTYGVDGPPDPEPGDHGADHIRLHP